MESPNQNDILEAQRVQSGSEKCEQPRDCEYVSFFEIMARATTDSTDNIDNCGESAPPLSDGEESGSNTTPRVKRTRHGGKRNMQAYGDKLLCLEKNHIKMFLEQQRCYCGNNCLLNLYRKGEEGEKIVYDIRSARFTSAC